MKILIHEPIMLIPEWIEAFISECLIYPGNGKKADVGIFLCQEEILNPLKVTAYFNCGFGVAFASDKEANSTDLLKFSEDVRNLGYWVGRVVTDSVAGEWLVVDPWQELPNSLPKMINFQGIILSNVISAEEVGPIRKHFEVIGA